MTPSYPRTNFISQLHCLLCILWREEELPHPPTTISVHALVTFTIPSKPGIVLTPACKAVRLLSSLSPITRMACTPGPMKVTPRLACIA